MANTKLYIAEINPVKFYSETFQYPSRFRSRFIDDWTFQNQIRNYEDPAFYAQKWMPEDIIHLQFQTDFTDIKVQVVDCYDNVVKSVIPGTVSSSIDITPLVFKNVSIVLDDIPTGGYYLRIVLTVDTGTKNYVSEPFLVADLVENSILIHYSDSTNDYDVAFDTDILFQFRVEGAFTGFIPENKSKVYEDQNLNNVRLSSFPFRSYKIVIGGAEGVPDWVADKVNRIFSCDYTSIDGGQFVRNEGSRMEPKREENYPMAGWTMDIREADNMKSKQFNTTTLFGVLDSDGTLLIDYDNNPVLYK